MYADSLTIKLPEAGTLTVAGDGKVTGSFSIDSNPLAKVLDQNLSDVRVSNGGIMLGTLANNVQAITYDDTGSSPATKISTDTIINGELTANNKLTLINGNTSAYLDVDQVGKLSQLLNSTIAGQKTVIDAGDGSKVGGVEFNAGAVTGVKSINSGDSSAKFKVTEDDSSYTFRAGNFQVTTGKENGLLNGEITFADTNRPNKSDEITLSEIISTANNAGGIQRSSEKDEYNIDRDYTTIENGTLKVREDGIVTIDGKLTAGNDSKIGNITISDGQLSTTYSGAEGGIARVNVTDLYDDHKIITEDTTNTYSSKNIKLKIDSLEQSSTTIGSQIQKIERFTNQNDGREGTSIAGNLDVYDDGTVIINYNQAQQVTIDSNGIKVGTGSAYINNDGFKAGADGKNSLTTSGLTAKEIRAGNDNTEFFVDGGGNVVANGTLNAAGGKFFVSAEGNITASGFLSVAGDKFRVNADGSINANNKFIVGADGSLRASDDKFTADKDGNVRAIGSLSAASDKFFVATDGSINVNQKFIVDADGTISSEGTLSVAGGKFSVDKDGALKAANNNFSIDADGKLISASGSQIGGVTVNGESLSNGTKSITVSELASDHALVNDINKGNENLYKGLSSVGAQTDALSSRTAGIQRSVNGITKTTTIENTLKVGSDGTVKINEGDAQQVIIDSNGIKVGKNSSRMNDSNGFATTRDLYVGADSADSPTAAGSKFYVNGSDGSLKAAAGKFTVDENGNVVAKGSSKSKTLAAGTNGDEFVVDENGNLVSKGTLSAADGKFTVDADGALKAANDNFNVDKDGNVIANGALRAANGAFSVDISGNVITSGSVRLNSGANSTQLIAGGVSFIKGGTTTTIDGETVTVSSSSGNKSFNLSDMADVGQNMTNLGNRIDDVQKNVDAEADARKKDVQDLNTAISNETADRQKDVADLNDAISKETADRQKDVADLNDAISKETADRQQDVKNLNDALSKETADRQQDVKDLNDALSKETADRQQDVKDLNDALSKETTERQQDVKNLNDALSKETADRQQDVKDLNDALSKETAERQQDVKNLNDALSKETADRQQDVKRLDTAISDEAAARQKDVTDLNGRVDDVNSRVDNISNDLNTAINDEKTKREQEVSRLDTAINDEKTKREQDVADLNGRVDDVQKNVDAEAAARQKDVADLNGRVDDVNSRVDNISNDLNTAINDEKTKREQEVSRLDGRIDTVNTNLGDLNDLDSDLQARDEYTGSSSVVGGINAEAAIRKEEVTRLDTAIADEAAARQADVARLDGRISDVSSRINKVGAMAAAIASLKTMGYDPEAPTEFSIGLGQYKGETGVALGFFHYPNKNFMINVSLSTSSGEIMGGIGATWRFGHKSPQKLLEEQREAQVKKEIAAAEAYKAARAAKKAK